MLDDWEEVAEEQVKLWKKRDVTRADRGPYQDRLQSMTDGAGIRKLLENNRVPTERNRWEMAGEDILIDVEVTTEKGTDTEHTFLRVKRLGSLTQEELAERQNKRKAKAKSAPATTAEAPGPRSRRTT